MLMRNSPLSLVNHYKNFTFKITLLFAELSSVALDGRIVAVSDEFFAEAFHLLLVEVS